ncbi:MAG: RecB family exonuclease [Acidobacteriota bacterium]
MPVYSHSRLSSFENCPLQYRYRYVDRIPRDVESIETFVGKRVHEVLEWLYRDLLEGRCPSLERLVARYHGTWETHFSERVRIVRTENSVAHYRRLGERCVVDYDRRYRPFDQGTTVGVEERVSLCLDGAERYRLRGYIDRLTRVAPGTYEIHDYKTSGSLPSERALRGDRQLSLYQMAVQQRFPDARDVRLVWHYLVFDQELTSRRSPADLEAHRVRTIRLIDTIEAAREFPPRESALCRWCEYRDICPTQAGRAVPGHARPPAGRPDGARRAAERRADG